MYGAASAAIGVTIDPDRAEDIGLLYDEYLKEQAKLRSAHRAANLLTVGATQLNGNGQDVVATAARINGAEGWRDWAGLFDFFGDGLSILDVAAMNHFFKQDYVSALYHIYTDYEEPVMSFIITGVASVRSALPDGK